MPISSLRRAMLVGAALACLGGGQAAMAAATDVPAAAASPTVAAIKERGALRVAAIYLP